MVPSFSTQRMSPGTRSERGGGNEFGDQQIVAARGGHRSNDDHRLVGARHVFVPQRALGEADHLGRQRTAAQFAAVGIEQPVVGRDAASTTGQASARKRGLSGLFVALDGEIRQGRNKTAFRLHPPRVFGVQAVVQTHVEHAEQQCLRHPEGQKDFPEQAAVHALAFSGVAAAARKYPTPRMGRMRSSVPGKPPSFLRRRLT